MCHKITVHSAAVSNMQYLQAFSPALHDTIMLELTKLRDLADPRDHCRVEAMCGELKGCYRLAIYTPESIRIIFRMLDDDRTEILAAEKLYKGEDITVEIDSAGFRSRVYDQPRLSKQLASARKGNMKGSASNG